MKKEDLEAFLDRDWDAVQASKDQYWAERKRQLTPTEAIRLGDQMRRHVLASKPHWPDAEERRRDLESHTRVSHGLRSVRAG